jgi:FkbM family methyltransferase
MNILETILKEGYLVFDVGCNIGNKANEYLLHNTKVVGFEPQPNCINQLINRFKDNGNVIIEPIGLDSKKGNSFIYVASHDTISSMSEDFINTVKSERFNGYVWNEKVNINVDTLDNMILKYGTPNYIKIDVEGYELSVLKGLTKTIGVISIEFTPELCQSTIDCINYIDDLNQKSMYNYGYREDKHFKFNEWITKDEMINYLSSVNDFKIEFGDVYIKNY